MAGLIETFKKALNETLGKVWVASHGTSYCARSTFFSETNGNSLEGGLIAG